MSVLAVRADQYRSAFIRTVLQTICRAIAHRTAGPLLPASDHYSIVRKLTRYPVQEFDRAARKK